MWVSRFIVVSTNATCGMLFEICINRVDWRIAASVTITTCKPELIFAVCATQRLR